MGRPVGRPAGQDSPSNQARPRWEDNMTRFAITALAALGILAGTVPAARAADTTCTGLISSGTINGNLTVPAGARAELFANATVTGNVQVGKGASLLVQAIGGQTVTIGGNVQAAQCQDVFLTTGGAGAGGAISVGGNVQIRNCTSGAYNGDSGTVTISGNFACDHNSNG